MLPKVETDDALERSLILIGQATTTGSNKSAQRTEAGMEHTQEHHWTQEAGLAPSMTSDVTFGKTRELTEPQFP